MTFLQVVRGSAKLVFAAALTATALHGQATAMYGSANTFNVFMHYSNDSSHIFIGQEQNRRIGGVGVGYSRRIHRAKHFDFSYEVDVLPITFVRDPTVDGDATVVVHGSPTVIEGLPFSGHFSGPTTANCASGTVVTEGLTQNGVSYTRTVTQQCGERWTYGGGISPLGLRFTYARQHRLEPFLVANGGFMAFPVDLPVNNSARFNFTFEGGMGLEWFRDPHHSMTLDYRFHHLSNGYRGFYNPGIDSNVFRVSYRFGR